MKWSVEVTAEFLRMAKRLRKKYRSLPEDLEKFELSLIDNPFQGALLAPGIRKIRMQIESKGGGKSKGARIITLTYMIDKESGEIVLLLIYDHNSADTVDSNKVEMIAKELGYNINALQDDGNLI